MSILKSRKLSRLAAVGAVAVAALGVLTTFSAGSSSAATSCKSGYYKIYNSVSRKVVTVPNASKYDGVQLEMWSYQGWPEQLWKVCYDTAYPKHTVFINKNSGKCIDVRSASTSDGAAIQQFTCSPSTKSNQRFIRFVSDEGGNMYMAVHSRRVMDINGFSTGERAPLKQSTPHAKWNQLFTPAYVGS